VTGHAASELTGSKSRMLRLVAKDEVAEPLAARQAAVAGRRDVCSDSSFAGLLPLDPGFGSALRQGRSARRPTRA